MASKLHISDECFQCRHLLALTIRGIEETLTISRIFHGSVQSSGILRQPPECWITTALYSSVDHLQPRIQLPNSPGKLFFEIGVFLMNIAVKLINLRIIGGCLTDLDSDWRWHLSIIARPHPRALTANIKRTRSLPGPTLPSIYLISQPAGSLRQSTENTSSAVVSQNDLYVYFFPLNGVQWLPTQR